MAVPRGYKEIDLGPGAIKVLCCAKCGALVVLHKTHTYWHKYGDK